ncbi:unnamed protein product, partial [Meganyctiphanes norvegica]
EYYDLNKETVTKKTVETEDLFEQTKPCMMATNADNTTLIDIELKSPLFPDEEYDDLNKETVTKKSVETEDLFEQTKSCMMATNADNTTVIDIEWKSPLFPNEECDDINKETVTKKSVATEDLFEQAKPCMMATNADNTTQIDIELKSTLLPDEEYDDLNK